MLDCYQAKVCEMEILPPDWWSCASSPVPTKIQCPGYRSRACNPASSSWSWRLRPLGCVSPTHALDGHIKESRKMSEGFFKNLWGILKTWDEWLMVDYAAHSNNRSCSLLLASRNVSIFSVILKDEQRVANGLLSNRRRWSPCHIARKTVSTTWADGSAGFRIRGRPSPWLRCNRVLAPALLQPNTTEARSLLLSTTKTFPVIQQWISSSGLLVERLELELNLMGWISGGLFGDDGTSTWSTWTNWVRWKRKSRRRVFVFNGGQSSIEILSRSQSCILALHRSWLIGVMAI